MRRVACSMTARTNRRVPVKVLVSKKSQASSAPAWERRKLAQAAEVRPGAGSIPAWRRSSPDGRGRNLDAEGEQFAVDAPVAPGRVFPGQAQHQHPDGADGARTSPAAGTGSSCVAAGEQVPVPAQDRAGLDEQQDPGEQVAGEPVQQRGQERPVGGREPRPGRAKLSLQDADLVAQRQGFRVFVPIACRQQPQ